jgi:cysteinyl-tRNA synthetase
MPNSLRLFNTISGRKERFKPLGPGKVSMFVCGPTVQSLIHIGHARTVVFYDVVARYLAHLGYEVNYLMNITDFDERITQAAAESGEDPVALARRFSEAFLQDMASLKCTTVSRFEPVSGHIKTMIQQVATLIDIGRAYVIDGWVYFDTSKFRPFGRLSHQSRKELLLRPLELSPRKRHLPDFALWRPEVLLEGRWESPWGLGSPGWHIQDTAVTQSLLGSQYDIHGGAYELVYPHHEAEIAQAESLTGKSPVVKYWLHTSHVNMKGRKMSKSLGNVLTVRDALAQYSPDELRVFLLSVH